MSEEAFKEITKDLSDMHGRNEARRIRARVAEARGSPRASAPRWPFELLQNALDAGPRTGRSSVTIRLRREPSKVVFEHDGAVFTSLELAALLSGGSSKEFDSEVTTGRFGTGFLVTHVLAERTDLRGLLEVPSGFEEFRLTLDRGGDEDAILCNIRACNEAIRDAKPAADLDDAPSARFEYPIIDGTSLDLGLHALRRALPYLYASRPTLGRVEIDVEPGRTEVWTGDDVLQQAIQGGRLEYRTIHVTGNGLNPRELRIYRFQSDANAAAAAMVLVERTDTGWEVPLPEPDAPRVYREYPLSSSGFVPISFVLDGKFDPDEQRNRPLMSDKDKELLKVALRGAAVGVRFAIDQKWDGAHLLARAQMLSTGFDPDKDEPQWWTDQLREFARQLAELPIVQCTSQFLPAASSKGGVVIADFVVPRLLPNSTEDETTVERLWPLVNSAAAPIPPCRELAPDWTKIADGWHGLGLELDGLKLSRITVSDLAVDVRKDAESLDQLRLRDDVRPIDWLASYLDIVGECWSKRKGVELSVLSGMLPNQNKRLCSPRDLQRDDGVSERLKDICVEIGLDVRSELLFDGFGQISESAELAYLQQTVEKGVGRTITELTVIHDAIEELSERLPEDKDCGPETARIQEASVKLIGHLWESRAKDAAALVQKMPLITSELRSVRWSPDRMMMAPVSGWHESAQPFAGAYPPHRILAELYTGCEHKGIPNVVDPLVKWGIAIADPITSDTPRDLRDRRLAEISSVVESEGVVVSRETFSQIALLPREVLGGCRERIEAARALLGLVLCHVAPHDPAWQQKRIVKGRRRGEEVDVGVRGALWLADLKSNPWVPVRREGEKLRTEHADSTTLEGLLDPAWLKENDAANSLLIEWFGFDRLALRLHGIAPAQLQDLRNDLARFVELGPAEREALAHEVETRRRRRRDMERCRRLGFAIQEAVKSAMERYDLALTLVDYGYDYEVDTIEDIEDTTLWFFAGPYLLEVKATTKGEARLTSKQAKTASEESSRYVLCVVDLRALSEHDLDAEWTAARVEPLAKIVPDIGGKVEETCRLVDAAAASSVAISNEGALRYEVPASVWESGISIADWVASVTEIAAPQERGGLEPTCVPDSTPGGEPGVP